MSNSSAREVADRLHTDLPFAIPLNDRTRTLAEEIAKIDDEADVRKTLICAAGMLVRIAQRTDMPVYVPAYRWLHELTAWLDSRQITRGGGVPLE